MSFFRRLFNNYSAADAKPCAAKREPRAPVRRPLFLHLSDISTFYDQLPEGSMVVIF